MAATGYGVGASPYGEALVLWEEGAITHLSLHDVVTPYDIDRALNRVSHSSHGSYSASQRPTHGPRARHPVQHRGVVTRDDAHASTLIARAFGASAPSEACPIRPQGTPFQLRVWAALQSIPPGETRTYGQIAEQIGAPRAARAVGAAVGANPIAWLIPCHRVLPAQGGLGGFRWGTHRKRAMLAAENALVS